MKILNLAIVSVSFLIHSGMLYAEDKPTTHTEEEKGSSEKAHTHSTHPATESNHHAHTGHSAHATASTTEATDKSETTNANVIEDWKGQPDGKEMSFGGLVGLGMIDASSGFAFMGTASKKIIPRGFVSDLNNSVSAEIELGGVALQGTTALAYSAHLRWDFQKDDQWTLYGLGGVGGNWMSIANIGRFELLPRFGVGSMYKISGLISLRGEISRDLIGVGVNFPL